jgi:hypothetical protein
MGQTTFSGPIKAGTISNTTGTTLGTNVANVGQVVMAQSASIVEAAASADVDIVIPANSQIVNINLLVITAWNGGTNTLDVGDRSDTDLFVDALPANVVGNTMALATAGTEANWKDIGSSDVGLSVDSVAGGAGVGVLTVQYIQNNNLS